MVEVTIAADGSIESQALSAKLGIPIELDIIPSEFRFVLTRTPQLTLHGFLRGRSCTICPNLLKEYARIHRSRPNKKQPIARAIGKSCKKVIDATAGFCSDSLLLHHLGFHVEAWEQNKIVYALLEDALRVAREADPTFLPHFSLCYGRAEEILRQADLATVIYLDPMFPTKRKKSALPQKHIQILKHLLATTDSKSQNRLLFDAAIASPATRVVVKRPTYALPLLGEIHRLAPTASYKSKLVRYDSYIRI